VQGLLGSAALLPLKPRALPGVRLPVFAMGTI
jgi:hypothetical protein